MDLQGTPIGASSGGQKNTTDPRAQELVTENPGAIASDSLAADSSREGGAFSENPNSKPWSQSGSSSTFNTTDTSGATKLDPASDAAAREATSAWSETSDAVKGSGGTRYPEGAGGQGDFSGTHSQSGYTGGPSGGSSEAQTSATGFGVTGGAHLNTSDGRNPHPGNTIGSTGSSGNYGTGSGGQGGSSDVDAAPGYITSVVQDPAGGPHGKNLTEGGFDGESKPGFAEPGSKNDPGRAALGGFENANAAPGGNTGPRQSEVSGGNTYGAVGDERA